MRIVVKIGSNVLTRADGKPNVTCLSSIVDQVATLRSLGNEVVLISSGAVACGRGAVSPRRELDAVERRQLFSAVGQVKLINLYMNLFGEYGIVVGQVLTQKDNFSSRTAYLNQRSCMLTMLDNGVIPIVNENDTASLTELMFTDNDELSGLTAAMIDADMLIILSNVDGIYTGAPDDPDSRLITDVEPGDDLSGCVVSTKSGFGRGGMGTKCGIARMVSEEGITVIIARGTRPGILTDLILRPDEVPHTRFAPRLEPVSNIKRWIAHSSSWTKGGVTVDAQAAEALRSDRAVSLLPIGVTGVDGQWEVGDLIKIFDPEGLTVGIGRASLSSDRTLSLAGKKGGRPVVHYDYLFID
ncbi:MAG: glutamate 5-kinase [Duncaniella sp.]|nr:glutamate 5-kinase [Duncaniella sp.]